MSNGSGVKQTAEDADFTHRTLEVKYRGGTLDTPARAYDARLVSRNTNVTPEKGVLFEYYTRSGSSTVNDRITDKNKETDHSYKLQSALHATGGSPLILLQEYTETSYPPDKQLQYLIRIAHSYSDFVLPPLISRITDELDAGRSTDRYIEFVKHCLDVIEKFNKKPVMGVIPLKLPFIRIEDLVDVYASRGVRALCLDFAASKPETPRPSVEQVLFALADREVLDETYLHAINVSPGRPRSSTTVALCHNILSFGYGVDSYGDLHRTRMKIEDEADIKPTPPRLFSRKDYGDYLAKNASIVSKLRTAKTKVPIERQWGDKEIAKLFNAEQQGQEASTLHGIVRENRGIGAHLGGKKLVGQHDVRAMSSLARDVRRRSHR